MQLMPGLLGLPVPLLVLLATQLPAQQLPTALRKMSLEEGEKILPHDLAFAPQPELAQSLLRARNTLTAKEEDLLAANSSARISYRPPFGILIGGPAYQADNLARRGFACPTGTSDCSSISEPDYCCAAGETCFKVSGSDSEVGCCPSGSTCGGSVSDCAGDTTQCSTDEGGGCCISGYVCASVGCVASTISVVTITTTSSTVVGGATPTTELTTVTETASTTVSKTQGTATTTTTTSASTTTATTTTSAGSTTNGGSPPYRPTGSSGSSSTTTTATTGGSCPTGFYACLATAGGGCCRTGRDCSTTSCPPISSTTITTDGATVVVPATDVPVATTTSTCASGWFLCGTDAGPVSGCCPSGYSCGTASCTLSTSTATATVQKELPSSASLVSRTFVDWALVLLFAIYIALAMS